MFKMSAFWSSFVLPDRVCPIFDVLLGVAAIFGVTHSLLPCSPSIKPKNIIMETIPAGSHTPSRALPIGIEKFEPAAVKETPPATLRTVTATLLVQIACLATRHCDGGAGCRDTKSTDQQSEGSPPRYGERWPLIYHRAHGLNPERRPALPSSSRTTADYDPAKAHDVALTEPQAICRPMRYIRRAGGTRFRNRRRDQGSG